MSSRTDKYKHSDLPTRSNKNKELYKQVYNAYDEFENLIVPSNAREINPKELKKEIVSRQDYHKKREYEEIVNEDKVVFDKRKIDEVIEEKNEVYDINTLLDKALGEKKESKSIDNILSNNDYLKKLKLDNSKTNIEQVKEIYDDLQEEDEEELMKTANLSLEILSDLKGNNDKTTVDAPPIKEDEIPEETGINHDFYSTSYKFSKKDFVDEDGDFPQLEEEEEEEETGNGKFFLKILLLIFGIVFIVLVLLYFLNYFNRV